MRRGGTAKVRPAAMDLRADPGGKGEGNTCWYYQDLATRRRAERRAAGRAFAVPHRRKKTKTDALPDIRKGEKTTTHRTE